VAQLAWKKWVCRGRAASDTTSQHKSTLSVKTRNQPMNFVMLKYYIGKILPIYSISAIFAHKSRYTSFQHSVRKPKLLRLWWINANSLKAYYDAYSLRATLQFLFKAVIFNLQSLPKGIASRYFTYTEQKYSIASS